MTLYLVMERGSYPDWGFIEADTPEQAAKAWEDGPAGSTPRRHLGMRAGIVAEVLLDPHNEAAAG